MRVRKDSKRHGRQETRISIIATRTGDETEKYEVKENVQVVLGIIFS